MEVGNALAEALAALLPGAELAEVFVEDRQVLGLHLERRGMRRSRRRMRGVSVRRVAGGVALAAHRDDPSPESLVEEARHLAGGRTGPPPSGPPLELGESFVPEVEILAATTWVEELAKRLEGPSRRVTVEATLSRQAIRVARDGAEAGRVQEDLRRSFHAKVSVAGGGKAVRRRVACVSPQGPPPAAALGESILSALEERAEAVPSPTGLFPVILAPAAAAVLVHEVLGHPLESDAAGSWVRGEELGPPELTLVDEPGREPGAGAYRIDDEGVPGRRVVLVEEGRPRGMLRDRLACLRAGHRPSGHGRRQSYRDLPAPRLACTVLEPGPAAPEALRADVVRGLLVESLEGGTVDTASGSLCLLAGEARLIEGGRVTRPVRGAVLYGESREWLRALRGIGRDLCFDGGATSCGKGGQVVPVVVGAPSLAFGPVPVGGRTGR